MPVGGPRKSDIADSADSCQTLKLLADTMKYEVDPEALSEPAGIVIL
jgi:hypothetical protein